MGDAAIVVDDVSKRFRLYHERNQSLKAAVMRRGRPCGGHDLGADAGGIAAGEQDDGRGRQGAVGGGGCHSHQHTAAAGRL